MSGPSLGGTFAGHRIEAEAGRGGMGVVYRAVDLDLDRVVALKVIAPGYAADPEFRDRFKRECRIAASLSHPHIVPIYRAGEEDGLVFVTMAFIEGTDLRALLREEGALDPARAVGFVRQVADALDAAHAAGLVHRDVKPGNILVGDGGHVYLTDFGLTKHTSSDTKMTATGMFVGTLDYIAPEQLEGAQADARADIYSLGCVLYELLTGDVPFPRPVDTAKILAHINDPAPVASAAAPSLPPQLDEVVGRALSKDPDARYPSAGDLARAAEAAVEGRVPEGAEHSVARGRAAPGGAAVEMAAATTHRGPSPRAGAGPAPGSAGRRRRGIVAGAAVVGVAAAAAAALALTGGEAEAKCNAAGGLGTKEKPLRVYSSLSLSGPAAKAPQAALTGAREALKEAGGKAGGCVVTLTSLDASTLKSGGMPDEDRVKQNARRAVRDGASVAYVGEWESGATGVSLPITNRGGLAQVSPSNSDPGLTVKAPGVLPGEPDKYYPAKRRTYVRVMPSGVATTAAVVAAVRSYGCEEAAVVTSTEDSYSRSMRALAKSFGAQVGLRTRKQVQIPLEGQFDLDRTAARVAAGDPPCVIYAAIGNEETAGFLNAINRALPRARIVAGDAILFDELGSQMSAAARVRTRAIAAPPPVGAFPASGRAFFRRLRAEYGGEVNDPFAAHGYEAMRLVLDALERAGASGEVTRAGVVKALFATRNRKSILGTYSVQATGDTTLSDHGMYEPGATRYRFERVVRAPAELDLTLSE